MKIRRSTLVPLAALALAGCQGYDGGGPMMSIDQYSYESMPDYPQTVTLKNSATGETLWTVDVPVGQKLVMKFEPGKNKGDPARPDLLKWDLMALSVQYEVLDNSMPVPPSWQRRVDVTYRRTTP